MATPKTSASRRRLSPEQRRQRLLDLGLELFGEFAYDQLSVDDIAQRAEISHGLLFRYFRNKRGYYVAVIREAAERLLERSEAALDVPSKDVPQPSPTVQLEVFLGFVEDNAGLFTLLMQGGIGVDPQVQEIVDGARRVLATRVAPGLNTQNAATSELDRLALTAWIGAVEAAAVEWAELRRRDATATDRQQLSRLLIQMLPPALRPDSHPEEKSP